MKSADFKKLIANQTAEELACWFLVTKVRRMNGLVEPKRIRQVEKFVPGWTWDFTDPDIKLMSSLSEEGKAAVRRGQMPMVGDPANLTNKILYENPVLIHGYLVVTLGHD